MSYEFTVERTFAAPASRVFEAWTRAEDVSQWFGTDQVEVPLDAMRWTGVPGDVWTAQMRLPDGGTIDWTGEFVEATPGERVELTMTDQPELDARGRIEVDLVEVDGGTRMTMRQSGDGLTDEQAAGAAACWNGFFDVMQRLVES